MAGEMLRSGSSSSDSRMSPMAAVDACVEGSGKRFLNRESGREVGGSWVVTSCSVRSAPSLSPSPIPTSAGAFDSGDSPTVSPFTSASASSIFVSATGGLLLSGASVPRPAAASCSPASTPCCSTNPPSLCVVAFSIASSSLGRNRFLAESAAEGGGLCDLRLRFWRSSFASMGSTEGRAD